MLKVNHVGKLYTDTYRMPLHKHDLWEVVYYSAGSGFVQIQKEIVPFETGDIFILPPNLEHSDWSEEGFQNIHFEFKQSPLSGDTYYTFRDNSNQAVLHIMCQMYDIYIQQNSNWENIINLLYELFFQYMYALSESPKNNAYVEHIRHAIISNISDPQFSLQTVFNDLHLSPNYARDLFKENVGCTPLQFLTEKRLDYARQLLASRNLSNFYIHEISYMCGFSDPYYFSRLFRKHVGVSPKEWKKHDDALRAQADIIPT